MMHKNVSVDVHQFAMVPRAEIPRSAFDIQTALKTTFDAGYLVPIYVDEVLPGDTFNVSLTAFARLATPIFPVMDNMHMSILFFYCPFRILWVNWVKLQGQQESPGDSIAYTVPQQVSPNGGYAIGSLQDYMGLPTVGQVGGGNSVTHSALMMRAYNKIFQDWFRDQKLQNTVTIDTGDGPDNVANYVLLRRGKRHDYFTSCLPSPQQGSVAVSVPLGTSAPVYGDGLAMTIWDGTSNLGFAYSSGSTIAPTATNLDAAVGTAPGGATSTSKGANLPSKGGHATHVYADLSSATAATINQLRQAFQIQRLLERDARGGTRYPESILSRFGVRPPDFRLQRPEYLGGGVIPIMVNPIAQTAQTGLTGGSTPLGTLGGMATALGQGIGFTQSFTEHGVIIGLATVQADLTYQQGLRRMWSRSTRYDFYEPVFQALGEQAVLNKEIYCDGSANDNNVFGYQEHWAEYRYFPSMITSLFRSTAAGTLDGWHLAQKFTSLPTLNSTFIQDTPPVSRVVAVGAGANGQQFIFDSIFNIRAARPMPLYSVPGMIDHF